MAETPYRVGIIGCGRIPQRAPDGTLRNAGIAESHARAYEAHGRARIVAAADINEANLDSFRERHEVPVGYSDYREMLKTEHLDIVSVCTWVGMHTEVAITAAAAKPRAILCEKPFALTLPDARAVIAACQAHGVTLAVNHQRRLGLPFITAKQLLDAGDIGELLRFEGHVPSGNLLDWGTHWFDMGFFYRDQLPVVWAMASASRQGNRSLFGVEVEDHAIAHYEWVDGVRGVVEVGTPAKGQPANRLLGSDGVIEVGLPYGPVVRVRGKGASGWREIEVGEGIHGQIHFNRSVAELISAFEEQREPQHSGPNALQALEVILASYESVYQRNSVALPLSITDDPIHRLIDAWKSGA